MLSVGERCEEPVWWRLAAMMEGTAIMMPKAPIVDRMALRSFPVDHHAEPRLLCPGPVLIVMDSKGRSRCVSSEVLSRCRPPAISSSTSESLNSGGSPDIGSYPCVLVVGDMVTCGLMARISYGV